jgi:hypothetical protein
VDKSKIKIKDNVGQQEQMGKTKKRIVFGLIIICLAGALAVAVLGLDLIPRDRLDWDLRSAIKRNRGGTIHLAQITQFQWDRLVIVSPYGTVTDLNGSEQYIDEGHCVFQFLNGTRIVHTLRFNRRYGDFAELGGGEVYSPDRGVFTVESGSHPWPKIRQRKE